MKSYPTHTAMAAALLISAAATTTTSAIAQDQPDTRAEPQAVVSTDPAKDLVQKVNEATGLELFGYGRGGFYSSSGGAPRGGYSLGGDLQKYRLGNEGDNYIEFGIGKKFALGNGLQWGVYYMPAVYNGDSSTKQIYATISGFSFAPTASFWAGQRYHRYADIHILDKQVMEDGDNYGAGVDGIPVGQVGVLDVSVYNSDSADNKSSNPNNAKRLNLRWREIATNPGGTLALTAAALRGDFAQGSSGGALGLLHKQKNFLVPGLNNALFLQASTGHASVEGKFYNLDDNAAGAPVPRAGAKQRRIVDAIDFQIGRWGGQALVGYQTASPDTGPDTKDWSVGGRLSYGIAQNVKLLTELGSTRRTVQGQNKQTLNKGTIAVALAPTTDFWSRPEMRLYVTHAKWNEAAAAANASSFGANGRRSATTIGVQMEAWWE
jgi:maltoporin